MTDFILRLFVKDYENKKDPNVRRKCGSAVAIIGIIVNLFLAAFKLVAGILSGAISITADAVNNLSDAGSQVVSLITFKISAKPADREHPFGYARIEYVASMIVSFLILFVSISLFSESIDKIFNPTDTNYGILVMVILGVSVLAKLWLFFFGNSAGKKLNSDVIRASATDSLSDTIATAVVLVSVIVADLTGFVYLDGIMGIGVAIMIALAGIRILKETLSLLLGESPNKELIVEIVSRIKKYPGIYGIHDLNVHNYGPNKYYASVHCEVDSAVPILESHDLIDRIEREFIEQTDIILVIHLDPIVIGDPELDTYREQIAQIVTQIDEHFTIHDFRMVKGPTHTNLIFDVATHFDTKLSDAEIVDYIQTAIAKLHSETNVYVVPTVEKQID